MRFQRSAGVVQRIQNEAREPQDLGGFLLAGKWPSTGP